MVFNPLSTITDYHVVVWEIRRNPIMDHMRVSLCHDLCRQITMALPRLWKCYNYILILSCFAWYESNLIARKRPYLLFIIPFNNRNIHDISYTDPGSYKFTIRTKCKRTENANKTNEKRTNASHERHEKCTINETNTRYVRKIHKTNARYTNERIIGVYL